MQVILLSLSATKVADLPRRPNAGKVLREFPNGSLLLDGIDERQFAQLQEWANLHPNDVRARRTIPEGEG